MLLITVTAVMAFAAKVKYVAVLEAVVDKECEPCKEIKKSEISEITAELRRVTASNLPQDKYKVMTKETIQAQGSEVLQECASENCIIKMGETIGADYIVKSSIGKFGPKFTLKVEMYETKNGTLSAVLPVPVRSESLYDILEKAETVCADMYTKFVNAQGSQPSPQPPSPQYQPQPQYQPPAPVPTFRQPDTYGSGTLTDSRDGKKYKTVVIGGKMWMGENLNYPAGSSWCYDNHTSNCNKYGRLYDWETARRVCRPGWHLPTRREWEDLAVAAGGDAAATALKTESGWEGNGGGVDAYGFSAMPGGSRAADGSFKNAGNRGIWWVGAEYDSDSAYYRRMGYNYDYVYEGTFGKRHGFSVRCVRD
jgi:uncharacterized protein (TIGR02145 family)